MMEEIEGCRFNGVFVLCEMCELQDNRSACIELRERTDVQVKYNTFGGKKP